MTGRLSLSIMVYVGVIYVALFIAGGPVRAQALCDGGPHSPTLEGLNAYVDCLARNLPKVWDEDVKPATHNETEIRPISQKLPLEIPVDCQFTPSYSLDRQSVVYPKMILNYSLYHQQALFAQLMGFDVADGDDRVFKYYADRLQPRIRDDREKCPRNKGAYRNGHLPSFPPSIFDGTISPAEYQAMRESVRNDPVLNELGAYLAIYPTFFVLLHEAGHAVLHPDGVDHYSIEQEMAADDYASAAFEANGAPVILGLGLFEVLYGAGRNADPQLACRVERLARNHAVVPPFIEKFGSKNAERLEQVRLRYIRHYSELCKA